MVSEEISSIINVCLKDKETIEIINATVQSINNRKLFNATFEHYSNFLRKEILRFFDLFYKDIDIPQKSIERLFYYKLSSSSDLYTSTILGYGKYSDYEFEGQ